MGVSFLGVTRREKLSEPLGIYPLEKAGLKNRCGKRRAI